MTETTSIKETSFIDSSKLKQLERFIRLYYEFGINIDEIETINHLLLVSCNMWLTDFKISETEIGGSE